MPAMRSIVQKPDPLFASSFGMHVCTTCHLRFVGCVVHVMEKSIGIERSEVSREKPVCIIHDGTFDKPHISLHQNLYDLAKKVSGIEDDKQFSMGAIPVGSFKGFL